MAKIMEIELKNIKMLSKKNGEKISANIFLNNKEIGTIIDDSIINFVSKENENNIMKLIKDYYKKHPAYHENNKVNTLMFDFFEELLGLNEIEKYYKQQIKKGFKIVIDTRYISRTENPNYYSKVSAPVMVATKEWNQDVKKAFIDKYHPKEYTIYSSKKDFEIQ